MSASVSTIRDDFDLPAPAAVWDAVASGSATVAQVSSQARFTLPSSAVGTHTARYTSHATYDLTGGSFYVNINTMVATGVAATAFFQVYLSGTNAIQWIQASGTLQAFSVVAGVSTSRYSAAWNAATYKYLRIREAGGFIFWDSSLNGTSWTQRATLANPFAVTDLFIDFGATCGNVASPGSFRLDDVNLILPALTTNWRWQQIVWPFDERTRTVTIAIDAVGTVQGYVVTADGVDASGAPSGNIRYFSGPMAGGRVLTEQATQAAAQAMAVNFPLDGRFDLPVIVQGHCYRIYDRSIDGAAFTLREIYPRRLIQGDDIEAESIKAIHIGVIDLDAQHRITAGGAVVLLDDNGLDILATANYNTRTAVRWIQTDQTVLGEVYTQGGGLATRQLVVAARGTASIPTVVQILSEGALGGASINLSGNATTGDILFSAPTMQFSNGAVAINTTPNTAIKLLVKGTGTTNTTTAMSVTDSGGLVNFQALDDGTIRTRTGNRWDLRGFVAGALTITGHVDVLVDGTLRRLLVG